MYFSFFHRLTNPRLPDAQPSVVKHEPESMSVEGGEFPDDAIRMEDVTTARNESLDETLSDLRKKGYDNDLSFETNPFALYGGDLDMRLNPEGFHVDEIDRTRDQAHPNDGAVVYAITSATGVKGVVVDTQGTNPL